MKKVLILSGSPRRGGNSDVLCDEFAKGAESGGHAVEKIFIKDKTIHYCTGCGVCNNTHVCVQKDDMAEILEKMLASDVIVLATPVYFYSMCGQLKTLIDRVVPRYTEIADKSFYLIAAAAEDAPTTFDGTIAGFRGLLDCLPGAVEGGMVLGGGAWQKGEIQNTPAMKKAFEVGKNI